MMRYLWQLIPSGQRMATLPPFRKSGAADRVRFMEIPGFDGQPIHITMLGDGRPLVLLHGLFSTAHTNWQRYGTADRLVAAGYRLILPDFRGHGQSAAPADPEAWPPDVLARDIEAILPALDLPPDWVLGGYSLGARTAVRLLDRARMPVPPSAAILCGMGLQGIIATDQRSRWFLRMIAGRGSWPRGTPEFLAEAFMKANVANPDALIPLLERQQSTPVERLAAITLPALLVSGEEDEDNGSAPALAETLPGGRYVAIPGNHMSSVTRSELADAIITFLRAG